MQAGALFAAGHSQAEVARTLGVARQNVSRWHARWQAGGLEALRSAGPTGPTPRLSDAQLAAIDQALRQGARAHGFDTDHWTLERVATVVERLTGVTYHRGHVWKLLRQRLGYRLQLPARRAIERDEQAIGRWVAEDWPWNPAQRPQAPGRDRLLGRVGGLAVAGDPPDLGAARAYPGDLSPLQVEAGVDGGWGWSWPTWPASASTRSSPRPSVASSGSATPIIWPSRSCATAACPYGEPTSISTDWRITFS